MRRPNLTIRRAMLALVGIALALGFVRPAVQILEDNSPHQHNYLSESPDGREIYVSSIFVPEPFWPRYARYLQGRPWRKQPLCRLGSFQIHTRPGSTAMTSLPWEACELAHPGIVERLPNGAVVNLGLSPEQRAEYDRLKARDSRAVAIGLDRKPIP